MRKRLGSTAILLVTRLLHELHAIEIPLQETIRSSALSTVRFSSTWQVLGPFQIGTREASWGADPLERCGGFHNLEYDPNAEFPSSLASNGTVKWEKAISTISQSGDDFASSKFELAFSNVDWQFQQSVYGWPALQYQAWIRGQFFVEGSSIQTFILITDGILEFRINRKLYWGGDYYGYRKSPPVLSLSPGNHHLDVRLIRDVRAQGGRLPPTITAFIELRQQFDALAVEEEHSIFPDAIGVKLSSDLASVKVRNNARSSILVTGLRLTNYVASVKLLKTPVRIHPGQTRPLTFRLQPEDDISTELHFTLEAQHEMDKKPLQLHFRCLLERRDISNPHKFTFLHPSGIVSYAILRPPPIAAKAIDSETEVVPILIGLHGAGVEADSPMVRHSLDATSNLPAWTLFPTGVSPWSSDDWHQWGFADVEASISAIHDWIRHVGWDGPGVDGKNWLVTGHSNGGQGTWYATTHRPDNVIAAVPASAYCSIQKYVPYTFWGETDPFRTAVIQAALGSYRHESLLGNCEDIPVLMQHGGDDDNVPVFHSRRMMDLAAQHNYSTSFHEVPGQGHYWDGVMTTDVLMAFYQKHLLKPRRDTSQTTNFTLTVANPADTGSKAGFLVYDLIQPGQLGRLDVRIMNKQVKIKTSNIRSFIAPLASLRSPVVWIDGSRLARAVAVQDKSQIGFILGVEDEWEIIPPADLFAMDKSPGGLDAILRSKDSFAIISSPEDTQDLALQIARNLYQYYSADVEILGSVDSLESTKGNVISLGIGSLGIKNLGEEHPIRLGHQEVEVRDDMGRVRRYAVDEHGLAALYLRRIDRERLELVVWGTDLKNLELISRLVPLMTGAGQPDFVIADRSMAWKGVQGVLAMGFFDGDWNVSRTSFLF